MRKELVWSGFLWRYRRLQGKPLRTAGETRFDPVKIENMY